MYILILVFCLGLHGTRPRTWATKYLFDRLVHGGLQRNVEPYLGRVGSARHALEFRSESRNHGSLKGRRGCQRSMSLQSAPDGTRARQTPWNAKAEFRFQPNKYREKDQPDDHKQGRYSRADSRRSLILAGKSPASGGLRPTHRSQRRGAHGASRATCEGGWAWKSARPLQGKVSQSPWVACPSATVQVAAPHGLLAAYPAAAISRVALTGSFSTLHNALKFASRGRQ